MDPLLAARAQMEVSLGFHMIFAALGIGMPLLMMLAEGMWLRTGQVHYKDLAKKWAKATALTFAVGAVSGTALSFELGLLWPRFMEVAGPIIGSAFALEGFAFFVEAIFIGLYLYGWDRVSPRAHWWSGVAVAVSGLLSGILVVAANAFMQNPVGFELVDGKFENLDPGAIFTNPLWFSLALHSSLSCYIATGFAVAGVYAAGWLRGRRDDYHRSGLNIAMAVGVVAALMQPLSGDLSAKTTAKYQPEKLAAMEALFETTKGAPLLVGGLPDMDRQTVDYAIEIPYGLSILAYGSPDAEVKGLNAFPADERPNALITHLAFQVMVGAGMAMMGLGLWFGWARWRRPGAEHPWLLRAVVVASPLGFLALEAGWIVTEVGRQPWIIYKTMRTAEGVTPVAGVAGTLYGFAVLYLLLGGALVVLLRQLATGAPQRPAGTGLEAMDGASRRADGAASGDH